MKDRIIEFLRSENKSSAQLAEEIGVQPSGISHILSGRNKPSLDFVLKMLEKYNFLSTEWLLFGKGLMYKDSRAQTLFDQVKKDEKIFEKVTPSTQENMMPMSGETTKLAVSDKPKADASAITRIVWFYADHSYDEFFPR